MYIGNRGFQDAVQRFLGVEAPKGQTVSGNVLVNRRHGFDHQGRYSGSI